MHDPSFFFSFNPFNTTPKQQTGYSKLANLLSKDALYYCLVAPFFLFYLAFDVFIYPNRDRLHPAVSPSGTPLEVQIYSHVRVCRCIRVILANAFLPFTKQQPSLLPTGPILPRGPLPALDLRPVLHRLGNLLLRLHRPLVLAVRQRRHHGRRGQAVCACVCLE